MILYFENLWDLFVDMSFYIVIGLIFTGLLHAFVKKDAILKHIGKDNATSVVKASVFGVPLPLCSCGVVPTAMYLGESGACKGSVVSFLTSTPQTGVDSLIATYGMLGPLFAVYRAISAFVSGIISGILTNLLCKHDADSHSETNCCCGCSSESNLVESHCGCSSEHDHAESHCGCSSEHDHAESHCSCSSEHNHIESHCSCSSECAVPSEQQSFIKKLQIAFTYAFGEFLDEIALHFVVGLLIAALISTLLPTSILSYVTNPFVSMLLMVVIGIPMYICSTASIPIAVSLMTKGMSAGAAFVFLFAGPVTNIASLAILKDTLGRKVTTIYLASAATCAIVFGLLLDYIIDITGYTGITNILAPSHEHEDPAYMIVVAVLFGVLVLKSLWKHFTQKSDCSCGCGCGH